MLTAKKVLGYAGASLGFVLGYLVVSAVANLFVLFTNTVVFPAHGFASKAVPYVAAYLAGMFGVGAGAHVVERFFPSRRLRPVVWAFAALLGLIWAFALVGLVVGTPQEGITVMALQTVSALFWAFKASSRDGSNDMLGLQSRRFNRP